MVQYVKRIVENNHESVFKGERIILIKMLLYEKAQLCAGNGEFRVPRRVENELAEAEVKTEAMGMHDFVS